MIYKLLVSGLNTHRICLQTFRDLIPCKTLSKGQKVRDPKKLFILKLILQKERNLSSYCSTDCYIEVIV